MLACICSQVNSCFMKRLNRSVIADAERAAVMIIIQPFLRNVERRRTVFC